MWLHVGVCALSAWLTALIVYIPLRMIEHKRMIAAQRIVFENILVRRFAAASERLPYS